MVLGSHGLTVIDAAICFVEYKNLTLKRLQQRMDQVLEREKWQNYELPIDETPLDTLLLKSQQFCVVQFSHAEASIKSSDGKPWMRCVAFCESLDSAYSVARAAFERGDKMETRIIAAGKCTLLPRKKRNKADFDALVADQKKANDQFDAYVEMRKKVLASPQEAEQSKIGEEPKDGVSAEPSNADGANADGANADGAISELGNAELKSAEEELSELSNSVSSNSISSDFGRPDEVFMQRFAAFAIVSDPDASLCEPVVIPLFAAETLDALATLVKTVSHNVDLVHVDIHCGPLLEWLPLDKPRAEHTIHKHPLRQAFEEKIKWIGKV